MTNNKTKVLVFATILILILSACTQPEVINTPVEEPIIEDPLPDEEVIEEIPEPEAVETPEPEDVEVPEPETPDTDPDDYDAVMEALISEKIQDCHMLNFILRQTKTADEWSVTIDRMIGKGADINPDEKEIIIDWLVSRNP